MLYRVCSIRISILTEMNHVVIFCQLLLIKIRVTFRFLLDDHYQTFRNFLVMFSIPV